MKSVVLASVLASFWLVKNSHFFKNGFRRMSDRRVGGVQNAASCYHYGPFRRARVDVSLCVLRAAACGFTCQLQELSKHAVFV